MEKLYNPDLMPEDEIKKTFVAREGLVEELTSLIEHQPKGAGVQHVVIIAPRGMGKTTVLLMVRFAIQDGSLAKRWQAVRFPEERYGIYDLADFWIEVLIHLAAETDDTELLKNTESLKTQYSNNDDLQEASLAVIKDWSRKHHKRLVVLADNFDMILEQINDERDNARLRDVLMNDGAIMLIGGATTFFHEARAYDQPLYNFFKIYDLPHLKFEQMQELLRRRAAIDKQENFEETLKANSSRLRVLEHFTGGNPRLVLMLYRVVTQSDISEVRRGLEKLLDEVTPFYKSKVESLPPQQRKILDHIARISSQTNEGLTPTEIAAATRMTPNQASAQLKRLAENGYVHAANLRGRSSYYTLSERLYAIWHQMRFGRNAQERMGWLVGMLKALYDAEEMGTQSNLLETRFYEHMKVGRINEAIDTLEHWDYLLEAMSGLRDCAETEEQSNVKMKQAADFALAYGDGSQLMREGKWDEALQPLNNALEINSDYPQLWAQKGLALLQLNRDEEALTSFDQALRGDATLPFVWFLRGNALCGLKRYEEAIASLDREPEFIADLPEVASIRTMIYLGKLITRINEGDFEPAKKVWKELQRSAKQTNLGTVFETDLTILLALALDGHMQFVRELINDSDSAEQFFPLARAIDYVQTGDEALLEKLSPEVRGVVEEIVSKLQQSNSQTDNAQLKSRAKKPKSGGRNRTRKQLR